MSAWRSLNASRIVQEGATSLAGLPRRVEHAWLGGEAGLHRPRHLEDAGLAAETRVSPPRQGSVPTKTIRLVFLSAPFPAANSKAEAPTPSRSAATANGFGHQQLQRARGCRATKFLTFLWGLKGQQVLGDAACSCSGRGSEEAKRSTQSDVFRPRARSPTRIEASTGAWLRRPRGLPRVPKPDLAAAIGQALSEVAAEASSTPEAAMASLQTAGANAHCSRIRGMGEMQDR